MALNPALLSERIAQARSEAALTQSELAARTGLDRSAIAKIETGARGVSAIELARIAQAVSQRIEWLLDEGPLAVASHRVREGSATTTTAIDVELNRLARDVEFVLDLSSLALPEREDMRFPTSAAEAEQLALQIRQELDLDMDSPAVHLAELFSSLGLLLFVSDLGVDAADGGTVHLERGAIALVNGASMLGRRRLTAAHELAHFLVADQYAIDWRVSEGADSGRMEALLDRFARAFLIPARALSIYWSSVESDGIRAAAVRSASHFQVDMATLATRLSETEVLSRTEAMKVRGIHTTKADILDFNLLVPYELEQKVLPRTYERAVLALYRGELISADRALDLLRGKYEPSDLPELPPRREDELWSILA